jgi:YD repeat-containing protein
VASFRNRAGETIHFGYDALGRLASKDVPNVRPYEAQHDHGGRRTRLMGAIRENGGAVLASFGYDELGRRASIARGNGVVAVSGTAGMRRRSRLGRTGRPRAGRCRAVRTRGRCRRRFCSPHS